ncbi:MAG: hypothetical protein ACYDD6_10795, partial [Acidimicrobiales bacterium]
PSLLLLAGMAGVMVPAILPTAAADFPAFIDNVVRFPLGLAGISSPAASPLLGHAVVSFFPGIHRVFPIVVAGAGGIVLLWVLLRRTPRNPAALARLLAWTMTVAILLAPATRVGYFLYPADFFVWTWLLRSEDAPAPGRVADTDEAGAVEGRPEINGLTGGVRRVGVRAVGRSSAVTGRRGAGHSGLVGDGE